MSTTKNFLNKKVMIVVAILAVGTVSAILVASSIAQATAQQHRWMMGSEEWMLQINGSVSVSEEASNFINENANVTFVAAAETAQGQIQNGRVFGGHLGVVQGYLVYMFFVANTGNQTGHLVVVDAGNDEVLHTSEGRALSSFGPMGGHGYGGWHGPWKAHGWRMWH